MNISQLLIKLKTLVYSKSETDSLLGGKASSSHTHTKSQITDFPTIPSKVSQLTNDSGFITGVSWDSVSNKPSTFTPSSHTHTKSQITDFPTIPTNTNQLTNGAGYITSSGSCNYANSAGSAGSASSATTAGAVRTGVDNGSSKDLVYATMANNDYCRISCGGSDDAGYLEIATGDGASEPIYVRQYPWESNSSPRTLTLLDGSGNTQFPGTVTAPTFSGNLNGNCSGTAGSVAWNNVSGKPTIPTNTNQLTNGAGYITSSGSCNYANSAGNSDTLDSYHEYSFLRNRGGTSTSGEGTLWAQIGIKEYDGALPDGLSGIYNWGGVVSLPGTNSRFDIYCSHMSSEGNGLYYRSGWGDDKKSWRRFIDSANIGSQSVNYANSAGSAGSCTETAYMGQHSTITYGVNRLQYYNTSTSTTSGATNNANPYNDWFYHLLMSHGNNNGYYGDIAMCFHSDTLAFRRIVNGSDQGWCYLVKHGRTIVSGYEVYVG
jgi:hypothetical protein